MKKYIKFLIIFLAIAVIVPQVVFAAWWNPFSWNWGWVNKIFHFQQTEQKQEQQIKQEQKEEKKEEKEIDIYSAYIETINESNSVTTKIHVKNLKTNDDKVIKIETCCLSGSGCGICPFPCQIKGFSPTQKYLLEDCGTSPQRTVNVINVNNNKEISFSSGSGYYWSSDEEITLPGGECKVNATSGEKICDSQKSTADWKTYTNTEYGFELKYPSNWKVSDNYGILFYPVEYEKEALACYGGPSMGNCQAHKISIVIQSYTNVENYWLWNIIENKTNIKAPLKMPIDEELIKRSGTVTLGNNKVVELLEALGADSWQRNYFVIDSPEKQSLVIFHSENNKNPISIVNIAEKIISTFKFTK